MTPATLRQLTPLALLGAALVAGCSSKEKTADSTSATTAMTTTTAMTPAPADTAKPAAADPSHFTDANILAMEITGDSGEVAIATMAKGKATSAAVRSYAGMLATDHAKGMKEATAVATKASITPSAPAGDTTVQAIGNAMTRLQAMPKGADFDSAFVNHEISDHKQDIADANAMKGAAQNADVKALVEKSLPELQKHLDRAQKLAGGKS